MSNNSNNAVLLQKRSTTVQRLKDAVLVGAVTGSTLMLTSGANAAELDFTDASGELTGVKTAVVGIIGTLVVLIGIGIAWSYFKRTAK